MLVFGGWNGTWCFNDLHILDIGTYTHRIFCTRLGVRVTVCKVYFFNVYVFLLDTMSWSRAVQSEQLPTPRAFHGLGVVDKQMILFGG